MTVSVIIRCCFEPDPDKRSTAAQLLAHLFLKRYMKFVIDIHL